MSSDKWYYDSKTGEVSLGKASSWDNRMGPYDSEADAREALTRAAARNEQADNWDEDDDWAEPDTR